MLGLLDRSTQLTDIMSEAPGPEPLTCEAALKTTALAATLLFAHGQTTERTVTVAERLGRALGVAVKVLPYWGELIVQLDGAPISQIVPAAPLGVDMGRVLAVTTVVDQVRDGTLPAEAAQCALISAGLLPPVSGWKQRRLLLETLNVRVGEAGSGKHLSFRADAVRFIRDAKLRSIKWSETTKSRCWSAACVENR